MSNDITPVGRQTAPAPQALAPLHIAKPEAATQDKAAQTQATHRIDAEAARKDLQKAMERLNEQAAKNNYNLNFSVDKASQKIVVKVRDSSSGEIIRQIPDETVLHLAQHLEDLKGLLHDKKI